MKIISLFFCLLLLCGCTDRTSLNVECKQNILHFVYVRKNVETGYIYTQGNGVLLYKDGSVVSCNK